MLKSLWIKFFFLLVAVSAIALSSAFLLRELMIKDFRGYLEGEIEDRAEWITASLESTYEKYSAWPNPEIIENTIWALMLGFDMKLYDAGGGFIIDTESAVNILSPLVRKRIVAISDLRSKKSEGNFQPYTLFLGGKEIGRVELKFLRSRKELVFKRRSGKLLFLSMIALGGVAMLLSIIFAKKLTYPIKGLTDAAAAIGEGDMRKRVPGGGEDELGRLSGAFNKMAHSLEIQESLRRKLTSNIAHELRTPLSAVRGELEGMMDGLIPADKDHLQSLYAEIGRLRKIIEGLEDLSQAEASSLSLNRQTFDLCPFLANITERFRPMFQESGLGLERGCEDGLLINADPDRLSQIIINLLGNALKASDKGGTVRLLAGSAGADIRIEIIDEGCGIKKEDLPFIFERFYKASSGGLGLGLTIAKELAEAHGGRITAESEHGKGSVFTIFLPGSRIQNS